MKALTVIVAMFWSLSSATPATVRPEANDPLQAAPAVTVTPDGVDFGDQAAKSYSKPQRITVTNTGGKDLYINSAVVTGENQQEFSMTLDSCTGAKIAAHRSCVIDLTFYPKSTGSRKAALTLTDSAVDSPQNVRLTGNGINSVDVPRLHNNCP